MTEGPDLAALARDALVDSSFTESEGFLYSKASRTREPLLAQGYLDAIAEAVVQTERAEIAERRIAELESFSRAARQIGLEAMDESSRLRKLLGEVLQMGASQPGLDTFWDVLTDDIREAITISLPTTGEAG